MADGMATCQALQALVLRLDGLNLLQCQGVKQALAERRCCSLRQIPRVMPQCGQIRFGFNLAQVDPKCACPSDRFQRSHPVTQQFLGESIWKWIGAGWPGCWL